ncbi:uncharacterized protein A4U43_C06F12710 [Asparagus officinalis]|uniref:Uncharacterized protein n=1 Tax=Asparagus officinalis TaxID=4686 RepID=A0A5P1EMH0_ASPOF|nr:uncharacterized protein A4U43_C06F12710 [Asparagus officinalis]
MDLQCGSAGVSKDISDSSELQGLNEDDGALAGLGGAEAGNNRRRFDGGGDGGGGGGRGAGRGEGRRQCVFWREGEVGLGLMGWRRRKRLGEGRVRRRHAASAAGTTLEIEGVSEATARIRGGIRIPRGDRGGVLPSAHRRHQNLPPARPRRRLQRNLPLRVDGGEDGGRSRAVEGSDVVRYALDSEVRIEDGIEHAASDGVEGLGDGEDLESGVSFVGVWCWGS